MESALLLRAIETALAPVVQARGGALTVAADPDHVLEILAGAAPNGWRCILNWAGDEATDPDTEQGVARFNLAATVQAARGLKIHPGADAYLRSATGRDPLLTLAGLMGRHLRGLSGSHPDLHPSGFRFISSAWLEVEGVPTRQITLTHRCILALEPPIDTPCEFEFPTA